MYTDLKLVKTGNFIHQKVHLNYSR